MKQKTFYICVAIITLFAMGLRFYDISFRPFHHDEGVNYHFLKRMEDLSYYPYSHENYHGPAFFYFLKACATPSAYSEFGMRLASNLSGIGIVLAPLILYGVVATETILLAMLLLACSASQVFHSRYAIHESLLVFSTAILAFSSYRWTKTFQTNCLYWIAASIALMIATKETFIINGFSVFLATIVCLKWKDSFEALQRDVKTIFYSVALFIFIVIFIFTGGFRWFNGLVEMFLAVPQWIGRGSGDTGHFKSFTYYLCILLGEDLPTKICESTKRYTPPIGSETFLGLLLPLGLLSFGLYFKKFKYPFSFLGFATIWSIATFLIYSFVKYKTPWLIINLTLPLILLYSEMLCFCCNYFSWKRVFYLLSGLSAIAASYSCVWYNWNINVADNPYYYVHTNSGMLRMTSDIADFGAGRNLKVLVAVRSYWPLPYYFKNMKVSAAYASKDDLNKVQNNHDILIIDSGNNWQSDQFFRKYYRLSGSQEAWVHYRKSLSPAIKYQNIQPVMQVK